MVDVRLARAIPPPLSRKEAELPPRPTSSQPIALAALGTARNRHEMAMVEIKVEISSVALDVAENVLLELGLGEWSLLQDVVAKRAWVVGIFASEELGRERWGELAPLLASQDVRMNGQSELRPLADADWRDSYKAHFHAWRF